MMGFENMNVRFFMIVDEWTDYKEVEEAEFLEADGVIEYERNTVFENGVKQICLTKNNLGAC